ncbi:MAG TPA: hypothetical protein VJ787_00370 [Thermoleophilia bacterium]|nr:hypothetical protein [Thermoleophilia bacterium]
MQTVNIAPHSRHLISPPTIFECAIFLATLVALGDRRDVYASERDTKAGRTTRLRPSLFLASSDPRAQSQAR